MTESKREAVARTLYERIYIRGDAHKAKNYAWPPTSPKKWYDHADAVLSVLETQGR